MWFIYIVRCSDDSLYTGITNNLDKRISDHNNSKSGAKYTKSRRPVSLVRHQKAADRNMASKIEFKLKRIGKQKKEETVVNKLVLEL